MRCRLPTLVAVAVALATVACGGDRKAKYPACSSDKDCKGREHCVDRRCLQCATDSQCAAGETCVKGACVLGAGACRDDHDCKNGRVCLNHRCSACQDDTQCGPNRRCSNGTCLARGKCTRDQDCADDEDCVKGTCLHAGRDKPPDLACGLEPIFFGFDQAAIDPSSKAALGSDAECIQQAPGRGVFLTGHTDPRGTEEYNIALSERRAQTVADFLARLGIDPARLRVIPKGETEASGTDESGWSKDRRVEIEWQ